MPQMAPMWWTMILFMTILMVLIMIVINYFIYFKLMKMNYKLTSKELIWLW
uniref:ATP synthase F0 subunit 8 n=1 Tax=Balclutha sp. EMHAU-2015-Zz052711 TaxID=2036851 RepID=A0A343K1A3_9HEMI|nr:ATP synthase F0 subunit 8 [Balclutha sp. EMHAU-2015-Zz052711]